MRFRSFLGWLSRALGSRNYSGCLRCGITWQFVTPHVTSYTPYRGCFPLCEHCWSRLEPNGRLPYYRQLFDQWDEIATAVLEGE